MTQDGDFIIIYLFVVFLFCDWMQVIMTVLSNEQGGCGICVYHDLVV